MLRERPFDTGTTSLNVAEGPPSGPPLVLLHGGSARWQALAPIIPGLATGWQVLALDLRGHGRSEWTPGRYGLADYVADVAAFVEHRVGAPAVLFGHSHGGLVALLAAARHQWLVRAVIVEETPFTLERLRERSARTRPLLIALRELAGSGRPVEQLAEALRDAPMVVPGREAPLPAAEVLGIDSTWFTDTAEALQWHDPSVLTMLMNEFDATFAGWDPEIVLPAVVCPVLLLQGDPAHGGLVTDEEVARALMLLPDAVHVRIEGAGHGPHRERPDAVVRAVASFLHVR